MLNEHKEKPMRNNDTDVKRGSTSEPNPIKRLTKETATRGIPTRRRLKRPGRFSWAVLLIAAVAGGTPAALAGSRHDGRHRISNRPEGRHRVHRVQSGHHRVSRRGNGGHRVSRKRNGRQRVSRWRARQSIRDFVPHNKGIRGRTLQRTAYRQR